MADFNIKLRKYHNPDADTLDDLVQRPKLKKEELKDIVNAVFDAVKKDGDIAILGFTEKYDGVKLDQLGVTEKEIEMAVVALDPDLKRAIDKAYDNIKTFHERQVESGEKIETTEGVTCWRESRAITRVGCYIPGGTAPLFSTVLMLGVPAMVAGVEEVVLCTPPYKDGTIHPAILYAAAKCGITQIYKVGGAQAVAGMVLGTSSIPPVLKIFGPGNQFVTAAKMKGMEFGVAFDLPAGPSEVLVLADRTADADFVAADLLAQAEHGIDSQVVLVAGSDVKVDEVEAAINTQIQDLPRANTAAISLNNGYAVIYDDLREAYDFINMYAPEHLILSCDESNIRLEQIKNAGSVFLGHFTPESAGDYASGTNHTLPTAGNAKVYSGVSVDSFVKKITFQRMTKDGLRNLGPAIMTMAQHESLEAHANAVQVRLEKI